MKTILEVVRDLIKPYIDTNASNIATVEDSTVENPYHVGDQLIHKGVLYNVTADISIGDTLEIGTNISVAPKLSNSIKSALNKLKSDGTSSGTDFNFDIQNGVPGWNSAANRGSSTFHPFSAGSTASDISYDNTTSGLTAIDVQAAIDEVDGNVDNAVTNINKKLPTYANGASSWDTTPTQSSNKPVTSGGVYTALRQMSYVGMIIHSTTFDTEAKVKAFYGGTKWVKIEGRFLLGQNSAHAINSTGGSETVTLTVNQIPSHTHGILGGSGAAVFKTGAGTHDASQTSGSRDYVNLWNTDSTGGGQAHDNMPPYKTVYIWERTQ